LSEFLSLRGILILFLTGAGILLTFRKPKFGLMAFIVLLFLRDGFLMIWFPPIYKILHLPQTFGILTFISWFIHNREYPLRLPFQFWLMILFLLVICFSRYLGSTEPFNHINHKVTAEFFKMCILFFLIVNVIRNEKDLKEIMWILIITALILTLYHYYHYKAGWRSIFVLPNYQNLNRNEFASTLVSMTSLAYIFFRDDNRVFVKIFLGFCLFSFISGVILTYSRGGAIALGVTLFTLLLQDKQKIKPIFFLLIIGVLIGTKISDKYINRIKSIKHYEQDVSAMGRLATNYAAINMLKKHPLLGVGAGNYNDVFLDYTPENLKQWVAPGKSIHNIILQVASETGFIGLFIFNLLIMKSFIDVIKLKKTCLQHKQLESLRHIATALGTALLGFFVAKQFGPGAYYSYIYIFLPLIVATKQIFETYQIDNIYGTKTTNSSVFSP